MPPSKKISKKDSSKGGSVTKLDSLNRQIIVERLMKKGYSLMRIYGAKVNGERLGGLETLSKDINKIRSRWLDKDPAWFHRARIARIEAVQRLTDQLVRLNDDILEIEKGTYDIKNKSDRMKMLPAIESQLTVVISKIYEIDADFDPEQYLDKRIVEAVNNKIKEVAPAVS